MSDMLPVWVYPTFVTSPPVSPSTFHGEGFTLKGFTLKGIKGVR
jgi:hypothetical protein